MFLTIIILFALHFTDSKIMPYGVHSEMILDISKKCDSYVVVETESKYLYKSRKQLLVLRKYKINYRIIYLDSEHLKIRANEKFFKNEDLKIGTILKPPFKVFLNLINFESSNALFISGLHDIQAQNRTCFKPLVYWDKWENFPPVLVPTPSGKILQTKDPVLIKKIINSRTSYISDYVRFQLNIEERLLHDDSFVEAGFDISLMSLGDLQVDSFTTFGEMVNFFKIAVLQMDRHKIAQLGNIMSMVNDRICSTK